MRSGFVIVPGRVHGGRPESRGEPLSPAFPPFVLPVGVFVNEDAEKFERLTDDQCGLGLAQLHGEESAPRIVQNLGRPTLKALRLKDRADLPCFGRISWASERAGTLSDRMPFSDQAYRAERGIRPIGSLEPRKSARLPPVILAGGLNPANVAVKRSGWCVPMESMSAAEWNCQPGQEGSP